MNLVKVSNQTISNTLVRRVGCWEATAKSEGNPHYGSFTPTNRKLEGGLSAECRLSMDLLRGGLPLPSKLRIQMERLFGVDFSTVRWHEGDEAIRLGAVAFTYGEHLYFPKGGFKPDNPSFLAILGHELAHVVQQRFGLTEGFTETVVEDALLENEADVAGCLVAAGQPVSLASLLGRTQLQKTVPRIQAIKLSINDIGAGELLQIIDTQLLEVKDDFSQAPQHIQITSLTNGKESKGNWFNFVGQLTYYNTEIVPCNIKLSLENSALQPREMTVFSPPGTKTERLYFPETLRCFFPGRKFLDLSYPDIADAFGRIMNGYEDQHIATDMLLIAMGQKPTTVQTQEQLDFLAGVVTLMFGIEASRFPSALVTSLMILDLIMFGKTYGRRGKPFTLAGAFDKKDNGQSRSFDLSYLYGGKYPYAVHNPGEQNARNRRILGGENSEFRTQLLTSMLCLNHRLIVPRREVTLFIHWLEAKKKVEEETDLCRAYIAQILQERLITAYKFCQLPMLKDFPGSARTDAADDREKKKPEKLANLIGKDVYYVCTQNYQVVASYFHSHTGCKLILDSVRSRQQYETTYQKGVRPQDPECKLEKIVYKPVVGLFQKINPCPCCIDAGKT